ncbi:MAG: FAD:protein FMN transferase [Acidobacteriota bacterium]
MSTRSRAEIRPLLGLFLIIVIGSGCRPDKTWQSSTLLYFDTVCEIRLFCPSSLAAAAQREISRVFAAMEEHFSPGSADFSSALVLELFEKALRVGRDSDGYFDITVGPLTELWGFSSREFRVPEAEEVQAVLRHVGWEKITLEGKSLTLQPGMRLDWGGIAKGWGVDLAAKAVQEMGVRRGFINAGGDLYCWGTNPDRRPWKVGIKHPRERGFLGILSVSAVGVATSGDYQRYFEKGGIRYHHIFDPRTGYPARGKRSVTVVGPETALCDGLATALFVCPSAEPILAKFPECGAVLVDEKGKVTVLGKPYPVEIF